MRGGDGRWQKEEDGEAAEDGLSRMAAEGEDAEATNRRSSFAPKENGRLEPDEERDERGDHPVPVLVQDPAHHRRHQPAVGKRPVGDGESGLRRGDERTGDEEKEDGQGHRAGSQANDPLFRWFMRRPGPGTSPAPSGPGPEGEANGLRLLLADGHGSVCVPSFSCHASSV